MTLVLPPLPAIDRIRIEVFGAVEGSAKWDEALWERSVWAQFAWLDITPESMVVKCSWGADDPTGVLTVPAAGSWSITTYDPKRLLDPSNGASFYNQALRPGKPIRLSYINEAGDRKIVRQGFIDEIEYDLTEAKGTLRGTDQVQLMVGAHLPEGQHNDPNMPNTLRARARYVLEKAGLGHLIPVEPIPVETLVNGSFETSGGWTNQGTNIIPNPTQTPAIDGSYVRQVSGGTGYPKSIQQIPAKPNTKYTLSGYFMKAGGGTTIPPSALIQARVNGTPGANSGAVAGTAAVQVWQPFSVSYTTPADGSVTTVEADLRLNNAAPTVNDHAWFDAVSMTEQPQDDPPVGKVPEREATVWSIILSAAYDALYAVWLDRNGVLRFRSFGNPNDTGFQAGGADGIAISNMTTQGSLQGVFTRIITFDDTASPGQPVEAFDATKAAIYGDILLKREQQVPNAQAWVDSVLADRAGASLQYSPGTLYPQTEEALESILDLGMVDIAHLVAESVTPTIDVAARVLGGTINADTGTGWTAELLTYIPAREWEEAEQPTPPPIEPPPSVITGVVRTYACTKDARLAHSSSLDAGNGLDVQLPIGWIGPYRNRAVLAFNSIPFGGVVSVDKAELVVKIGTNACGAFGSDPKVQVSRVTQGWSEGSYNVNCGFGTSNSVKYPGPSITSSGATTSTVPKTTGSEKAIDITAIARAWLGGSGQYGLMVKSAGEDTSKYTTCFKSRHDGTSGNRPFLRLTLTVSA